MKKRLFAIMLALAMLLAAVPALAEEGDGGEALENATKITCSDCKKEVESVDANGLCAECVLKQNNTQQIAVRGSDTIGGGEAGGTTGNTNDNTVNPDNTGGNTSGTTGGTTGGEKETCEHTWTYQDARSNDSTNYCYKHKKTCSKCGAEEWEDHVWDRSKEMVEESTCTKQGKDKLPCQLCTHVTYVSRELKPHTKDKGTVIKSATCTEKGTIQYTCTVCQAKLPEEEIPALGHTISENVTYKQKPTCTKAGIATYTCGRCGDSQNDVNVPAIGHDYGEPTWNWCGVSSATATFRCRRNCGEENAIVTCQARLTRSSINNCGYYTYTATVQFNGKTYTDMRTDYSCRPDWYYDPCYYNNPCGHWGCGNVCTRYSNCVPCRDYRTTFRVGGYNCLATPKTGDVSVIGMALISLAGAGAAIMGKKRK